MRTGIYKIYNKVNGKAYVGLSVNIDKRWADHIYKANNPNSKEYDKHLYRAMRKYGLENFSFEILELCDKELLETKEIYYINELNTFNNGYNETIGGDIGGFEHNGEKHPNHSLTENDVIDIRTRYAKLERKKEVWNLYQDKVGKSGFDKVWKGETWKNIMPEVYTPSNIAYHKSNTSNTGSSNGTSKLTENDVIAIRTRKKNGEKCIDVQKDYPQVTRGTFTNVWYYSSWKHIIV